MIEKQKTSYIRVALIFMMMLNLELIAFVRNVLSQLKANPAYTDPNPPLATVATAVDTFETAVQEAVDGGQIAIARRNAARAEVLALTRQLASYVNGHCNNDLVTLLSSGFTAVKPRTPSYVPIVPGNQRLEQTAISGELLLKFDRISNAVNYSVELATSPDGPWESRGLSTTSRVKLGSLTAGKVYWARARANGAAGSSDFGGPATAMSL